MRFGIDWWRVHDIAMEVALHSCWLIVQFIVTGIVGLLFSDRVMVVGAVMAATGVAILLIAMLVYNFAYWMARPPSRLC